MTTQRLDGRVDQAFGHMIVIGLCAIAEQRGFGGCRIQWTSEMAPAPLIHFDGDWGDLCAEVQSHAALLADDPESWINASFDAGDTPCGVFSPRVKALPEGEWRSYEEARARAVDRLICLDKDLLSARMIGAIGRPAYWGRVIAKRQQQDDGASRWEMTARNRGSEFVSPRFRHLAHAVSKRSPDSIAEGLLGHVTLDEHGKECPQDSRLATGLRAPGSSDAAAAWCALWGISQFPLSLHLRATSGTAGYDGTFSRGEFVLPVPTGPVPLARYRSIVASYRLKAFARAVRADHSDGSIADGEHARTWLARRSVAAVVRFPLFVSSNVNAPERWAETGIIHSTAAPIATSSQASGL